MDRAITQWSGDRSIPAQAQAALAKKLNKSYTIYGQMLLLPPSALDGPEWKYADINSNDHEFQDLCEAIAKHLKVTHIALNKPIPLHNQHTSSEDQDFNVLRSPISFTPLYGDFGPSTCSSPPTPQDFSSAFWVTAKQNGIYQTWAPRWTMFSRGNISEKARLLTLPSVVEAVNEGTCAAVDLYAGIGYFAFSYVRAGVTKVLCWDLSAWSCEGLRRGASKNRWRTILFEEGRVREQDLAESEARLLVFNESNVLAPARVAKMVDRLPPIRHVNCGMLPSSRQSLELAAELLDEGYAGWIHVHENFLVEEIETRAEGTRVELEVILRHQRNAGVCVQIEYINRLKSYAPGVMHCVIDIVVHPHVPP